MKKRLKINGIIIFIATVILVAFSSQIFRHDKPGGADIYNEIFGIAFILLGQIMRVSARGYKAENSQNGLSLIKDGPYSLVRNPMYLGILMIGLGVVFMLFNWWAITIFLIVFAVRYILLIFKEEKKLLSVFGKEYKDYCAKIPRILPSPYALFYRDIREYLPLKLKWVKKEIGPILTLLSFVLICESWEDIMSGGLIQYLREAGGIFITILLFIGLVFYLNKKTHLVKNASIKSQSS